eukprot:9480763-Pyramimonas_sp.AAC.1
MGPPKRPPNRPPRGQMAPPKKPPNRPPRGQMGPRKRPPWRTPRSRSSSICASGGAKGGRRRRWRTSRPMCSQRTPPKSPTRSFASSIPSTSRCVPLSYFSPRETPVSDFGPPRQVVRT